jgi:hypothetical protein
MGATVMETGTLEPCAIVVALPPLTVRDVVVACVETLNQLFTKFETFTEPKPVARSYPAAALYAGAELEGPTSKPTVVATVLLQFGDLPVHGTELLLFATSLNVQVAAGRVAPLAAQDAPVCLESA